MKHIRIFVLTMITMVLLVGCGGKPSRMDEKTYNLGCKALEAMDAYNSMDLSKDEAEDIIQGVYDRLDSLNFEEGSSKDIDNGLIKAYILNYKIKMHSSTDGLVEKADELRKVLNK